MVTLFSSDVTRGLIVNAKASINAALHAQSASARPASAQLTARDMQLKDPARAPAARPSIGDWCANSGNDGRHGADARGNHDGVSIRAAEPSPAAAALVAAGQPSRASGRCAGGRCPRGRCTGGRCAGGRCTGPSSAKEDRRRRTRHTLEAGQGRAGGRRHSGRPGCCSNGRPTWSRAPLFCWRRPMIRPCWERRIREASLPILPRLVCGISGRPSLVRPMRSSASLSYRIDL